MGFGDQRQYLADGEQHGPRGTELSTSHLEAPAGGLIVPVVLSGGGGSRLWPFSTNEKPKQFLSLVGSRSLFREALDRVRDRLRFSAPIVVGSVLHEHLCEPDMVVEGESARLILEPCARNTAVAVAMAAVVARDEHGEDALLLVMPSDHVIEDLGAFHAAVTAGEAAARAGRLVTFGVPPTGPETGYGYLQLGDEVVEAAGVMDVVRFVEKPPLERARALVADGRHLWNAGIFLFEAGALLREMRAFAPEIARIAEQAIANSARDGIRIRPEVGILADCPSESVDCAVMEHSSRVAVVPMSSGWSDLGSWDAIAQFVECGPSAPVTVVDCDNCYIRSEGLEVAALGLRDLIIVASGQRLLILPRGRSQEVKKLLSAMESAAA